MQHLHYTIEMIQNILSCDVNNFQTQAFKKCVALIIIVDLIIMRATIDFNNNIAIPTEKIHNIVTYNFLPVKIIFFKFFLMQLLP